MVVATFDSILRGGEKGFSGSYGAFDMLIAEEAGSECLAAIFPALPVLRKGCEVLLLGDGRQSPPVLFSNTLRKTRPLTPSLQAISSTGITSAPLDTQYRSPAKVATLTGPRLYGHEVVSGRKVKSIEPGRQTPPGPDMTRERSSR